jgi:hypothetical protein
MNVGDINKTGNALEKVAEIQAKILAGEDGDLKLTRAFAELGVSLDSIKGKNHHQIFFQIAESLKDAEVSAEKLNAIGTILGGKGDDLLPMFRKGLDSAEANAGVVSNNDVEDFIKLQHEAQKALVPTKEFWSIVKTGAANLKEVLKIGFGTVTQLPSIAMEMPESFAEGMGKARRGLGAERVRAREKAKALAQVEGEEKRKADELRSKEEAERQEKLQKKLGEIRERQKNKAIKDHIKNLTSAQGMVEDDINSIMSPNSRSLTSWQRGGEGARIGMPDRRKGAEKLISINEAIKAELQRANMELQKLNSKGEE